MPKAHIPDTGYGDAETVQTAIVKTRDAAEARRLQGIRFRMLGKSVTETCELLGIHPHTLRKWVLRWNSGGFDPMRTQPRSGRPRKLDNDIRDLIVKRIEGTLDNGEPFTAVAIHGYLKKTPLK